MSVRTSATVWERSQQSGTELLMLLAIADFADDNGNAYPSVTTLATKCRTTPRHANRILAALRSSGELEIRMNKGPRGTNRYRITLSGMTRTSPLTNTSSLTPTPPTPDIYVPKPLTPASDEPSLNHHEPPVLCVGFSGAFDSFWSAYPRKVNKPAAKKAFAKLKVDSELMTQMLAAINKQRLSEQWIKDSGRFIPHPATWLNGERWTDETQEAAKNVLVSTIGNDPMTALGWATSAGFLNRFEAENAGCSERNAHTFANGRKRVTA